MKDRPRLYPAQRTTVAHLVGLPRPSPFPPAGRLPRECHIYSVVASVTLDRTEADLESFPSGIYNVCRPGGRVSIERFTGTAGWSPQQ